MNTAKDIQAAHQLKAAQANAKLILFIGPPKTGTTSIIASLGAKANRRMLCLKNIFFQEISDSMLTYNQLAKSLCQKPSNLNIKRVELQGSLSVLAAEGFWGCIKDQSLYRFLIHAKGIFDSIEIIFVKRNIEDLAISQLLQGCKLLVRSPKTTELLDDRFINRQCLIEAKIISFLLGKRGIIRSYSMNYLSLSRCRFPVSFIDYDKSEDIVSDFFVKVLGCELRDQSKTALNRTFSAEDGIKDYLSGTIRELLRSRVGDISQARKDLLNEALILLPSNLKLAIRRIGGSSFRSQASEIERKFNEISPAFKLLGDFI